MTFFCGVYGCRGFRHQIEGDQQVPSIPVIARELRCVCVPIDRSVSVSFIAEFHFTAPFFNLYLFVSAYTENKEIMISDKEMYFFFILYFQLDTLFSVYIQYLLSSFLYMFQASQAHHQEV